MRLGLWLVMLGAACGDDASPRPCETLAKTCDGVLAGDVGSLLDEVIVTGCQATAAAGDDAACTNAKVACANECSVPAAPDQELRLFGCWRDAAAGTQLCFGRDFVPGATSAHAYGLWSAIPSAGEPPTFRAEFETRENFDRIIFYDYGGTGGNHACARIRLRAGSIFLTGFLENTTDCDHTSTAMLGPFVTRWDRP